MSGPNSPEPESADTPDGGPTEEYPPDLGADSLGSEEFPSQAYSAPESEQFVSAPYVPADPHLYDYDSYGAGYDSAAETDPDQPPRWPWVVGTTAIIAAIALVVSVSLLVTRTDTDTLANPTTTTSTQPPVQDEITTTTEPPPPPPPPPPSEEPPPPPPPIETVTVTPEPAPPPPATTEAPPPETTPPPPETTTPTTPAGPRQVTYSVTGTKAPGDIISVTFVDSNGRRRTQRNVYIPWSLTVTPISNSEVGSVQASSLFLVSKLNCSITSSDGTVLSSNTGNAAQTSC